MLKVRIIPVVLIRNEEFYIDAVLRPLVDVFGTVCVGDTGSEDSTLEIIAGIPGVVVHRFGVCTPYELTDCRRELGKQASLLGASHQLLVDGDEMYTVESLRWMLDFGIPNGGITGFSTMLTLDRNEEGKLWEMNDPFTRQTLLPAPEKWGGVYPFDVPESYGNPDGYFYYSAPAGMRYHAVHLHRLQRSRWDGAVHLRKQKQYQFGLQNLPNIIRARPYEGTLKNSIEGYL